MTEKHAETPNTETRAKRVKGGIKEWLHKTFTLEGREAVQRKKLVKKYAQVLEKVPSDQRAGAEALIQKQAHDRAVGSIVKDALLTTMAVGAGAGVIAKREAIGEKISVTGEKFLAKHPKFAEKVGKMTAKFTELRSKISSWPLIQKTQSFTDSIINRVKKVFKKAS